MRSTADKKRELNIISFHNWMICVCRSIAFQSLPTQTILTAATTVVDIGKITRRDIVDFDGDDIIQLLRVTLLDLCTQRIDLKDTTKIDVRINCLKQVID